MAPHAHSLSKRARTLTFFALVAVFFVSTPLVWYYANGYRFVSSNARETATTTSAFMQTGGLFIGVTAADTIFVNDVLERGSRLFSSARYIGGVTPGTHRVHVQREGAHTWVKNISVDSKLVTEAYAFNLATSTRVRLVSPSLDTTGASLLRASSTIAAQITNEYRASATARAYENPEYTTLRELFTEQDSASSTATSSRGARTEERVRTVRDAVQGIVVASSTEEILVAKGDIDVVRRGEDIVARYRGSIAKLPYYFCADFATSTPCVPEIVMDRQGHAVLEVAFYPSTTFDALILTRDDGVVVTELDPRGGWQNTQPLVWGQKLSARVSGTQVYIADKTALYEVVTK
ncbi:hypothetical protein A3C89_00545 [Candidatus Kaiserbacteria bacterium RIFCSPHIGHO2_02_FULL_50_50]|uniref:PEGA domain-containing protein n=1 Tax=Candidatus Kaiserbacteria bacterium RIFCSPHIGHO2_02_FULL_50_50 TaxID=1798492 RepID=A0A1F6DFR7_9BACT|nr:MAG: hypothetical protein A3C89_00545 [Candidatus Kaiserbacteria bacterium RIFCSPHIGHO2_02_FULL_50_50]OGG88845.1 MAG: hypothetical protein A3G62_02985 [Candidatus Kaiserbacteria bacterium RIFCSPLOWO2_12_FULL_50_10]